MVSELWCIRIPGPDDVWAMASKADAEAAKEKHDSFISKLYESGAHQLAEAPLKENMLAVVELWPWSSEEHAEALAEQD